jgi:hypothetical protein
MSLLNQLSRGHNSILIFDCEFWHVLHSGENVKKVPKEDFFFLPREIGGIHLTKGKDWKISSFFVTLDSPAKNMALPISHFSTVSQTTANKLNELERQLELSWGESFYSELTSEEKDVWKKGLDAYRSDPNIKKHHKPASWLSSKFMKLFDESLVIVKGTSDIDAIQNFCSLKKIKYSQPAQLIDIANWNVESKRICGSAKLEESFNCLKHKFSPDIRAILSHLDFGKAHDPTADAAMTLAICLYIVEHKNT